MLNLAGNVLVFFLNREGHIFFLDAIKLGLPIVCLVFVLTIKILYPVVNLLELILLYVPDKNVIWELKK